MSDLMNQDRIFSVIKQAVIEVLPDYSDKKITLEDSLRELGANSVDRAEIIITAMAVLQVKIPLIEFAQAKNINELVFVFMKKNNRDSHDR